MSNVVKFPGKPEDDISQLACPEEGCGNTFFQLNLNEETQVVTPTCGRCGYELDEVPYEGEEQE